MAKAQKCNPKALGISLAIVSALFMLLLSVAGGLGFWLNAVEAMKQWHLFYDLTIVGTFAGVIEAAVFGFIAGWLIGWFYNKYNK